MYHKPTCSQSLFCGWHFQCTVPSRDVWVPGCWLVCFAAPPPIPPFLSWTLLLWGVLSRMGLPRGALYLSQLTFGVPFLCSQDPAWEHFIIITIAPCAVEGGDSHNISHNGAHSIANERARTWGGVCGINTGSVTGAGTGCEHHASFNPHADCQMVVGAGYTYIALSCDSQTFVGTNAV